MRVRVGSGPMLHGADHTVAMLGPAIYLSHEVVEGAPYSAEAVTEIVQRLSDGNTIRRENKTKLYRDSAGRTRREDEIGAVGPWAVGGANNVVFIHDPAAGVQYVLHPDTKTAEKISMPKMKHVAAKIAGKADGADGNVARREIRIVKRTMKGSNRAVVAETATLHLGGGAQWIGDGAGLAKRDAKQESLGSRVVAGVDAEGTRTTTTIPAGAIGNEQPIEIVSERWYSPELKLEVMTKRSDPRYGETTYELKNLRRVEPLASLFEVPVEYELNEKSGRFELELRELHEAGERKEREQGELKLHRRTKVN